MRNWQLKSWQTHAIHQQIPYQSDDELHAVIKKLTVLPPLIPVHEIKRLQQAIAKATQGSLFILQGGDCAETFSACDQILIEEKMHLLHAMKRILSEVIEKPVVCIGRIAGQYAKPRSTTFEEREGLRLPSYRGDLINDAEFSASARTADPYRLLTAYECTARTLAILREIQIPTSPFYTSHEALHLHYEAALTHQDENGNWYNQGTHFPWIGMRTAHLDSAHIEYIRGISNPLALKIGPQMTASTLIALLDHINPEKMLGRITLITRFSKDSVRIYLPLLIDAVMRSGHPVMWSCDPMHGNTSTEKEGRKLRYFSDILSELEQVIQIHQQKGTYLGGVHLELTPEPVTECTERVSSLIQRDVMQTSTCLVDPRLNTEQSIKISQFIASKLKSNRKVYS